MPHATTAQPPRPQLADRRRQQLEELADGVDVLPGSFVVPMRVLELHRSGSAGLKDYADVIALDASLAARVLSLANSAAFAPASPVTKLGQAVGMIGLRNLMPLLFGASLAGIFNALSLPAADRRMLWRSSVLKGVAAREFCASVGPAVADEAFLCGLLQDIAVPVILVADRAAWPEVMAALDAPAGDDRADRELRLNGLEHGALGERLARRLGLPPLYAAAIGLHHAPPSALGAGLGDASLAAAIALAAELPHRVTQLSQALVKRLAWRLQTTPGRDGRPMSPPAAEALIARVSEAFEQTLSVLGDADENSMAFRQFMQALSREVASCLGAAIGGATAEISTLKTREAALTEEMNELRAEAAKSEFDPLTGILNRRGYDARVPRWLEVVAGHRLPCVVGYADMDDFKQTNDRHGHAAGDRALVATAKVLASALAGRGMAARLGGDEFAFVFVPRDLEDAAAFAGRLREELAQARVSVEGQAVGISASVGLVAFEPASLRIPLAEALKRADELMYGVKKNGKGRCMLACLDDAGRVRGGPAPRAAAA